MPLIQRQQFNPATGRIEIVFVDTGTGQTVGTYGGGEAQGGATPGQGVPAPGFQEGDNQPNLATPSSQAPQGGFSSRHPRAASFFQNLAPALAAIAEPAQPTPYPVSGFSSFLQGLTKGAQSYVGAKENIQTARVKKATTKASEPGLKKLEAGASPETLSPGEQYGLQLAGVPAPATTLSGAERRTEELGKAGIKLTPVQQAAHDLQQRQIDATIDYQKRSIGLQEDTLKLQTDTANKQIKEQRAKFVGDAAISGIPGDAAIDLFNSAYLGTSPSAETLKKLADSPSAQTIRAQAAGFAAKARGQQLIGNIVELINKKPNLTDDDKLALSLALQKINTITDNPSIFLYNSNAQTEYEDAIKTIERLLPEAKQITPEAKGWFDSVRTMALGFLGISGGPEAEAAGATRPAPVPDAGRTEYDALVKEAQAAGNKLPPDKAKRLQELAARFR